MKLVFSELAWDDCLYWQAVDKKTLRRINQLIRAIQRAPFEGIGKPEALRHNLAGFWSRRIDGEHRLVYRCSEETVEIAACRYHY